MRSGLWAQAPLTGIATVPVPSLHSVTSGMPHLFRSILTERGREQWLGSTPVLRTSLHNDQYGVDTILYHWKQGDEGLWGNKLELG